MYVKFQINVTYLTIMSEGMREIFLESHLSSSCVGVDDIITGCENQVSVNSETGNLVWMQVTYGKINTT